MTPAAPRREPARLRPDRSKAARPEQPPREPSPREPSPRELVARAREARRAARRSRHPPDPPETWRETVRGFVGLYWIAVAPIAFGVVAVAWLRGAGGEADAVRGATVAALAVAAAALAAIGVAIVRRSRSRVLHHALHAVAGGAFGAAAIVPGTGLATNLGAVATFGAIALALDLLTLPLRPAPHAPQKM